MTQLLRACVVSTLMALAPALGAQERATVQPARDSLAGLASDTARGDALRVFLDCESFGCRLDYFITEIRFVDWMRDRKDADVHLLVTSLESGSGGRQYTVTFLGQRRFAGWSDTLVVSTLPRESEDNVRRKLARSFTAGLVRYAMRTSAGERIAITYDAPAGGAAAPTRGRDPWNFWTFTPSVNAFMNGQSQQSFMNLNSNFRAARITESWKVITSVGGSYNRSRFTFDDGEGERTSVYRQRSFSSGGRAVRSIGGQWSAGLSASAGYSDFRNHRLAARLGPTIEWNLFPWTEATRRQLTFAYSTRAQHFEYKERTLFGETRETRASHLATIALDTRQRWGTAEWAVNGSQFLHDLSKSNISTGVELDLRLVKGLSLRLEGEIARVRDQLYLPGAGLDRDEVLLQQRALATSYEFFTFLGLGYTFGSIYNTVVNPRLDTIERAQ